jgi:hypothetical protein
MRKGKGNVFTRACQRDALAAKRKRQARERDQARQADTTQWPAPTKQPTKQPSKRSR